MIFELIKASRLCSSVPLLDSNIFIWLWTDSIDADDPTNLCMLLPALASLSTSSLSLLCVGAVGGLFFPRVVLALCACVVGTDVSSLYSTTTSRYLHILYIYPKEHKPCPEKMTEKKKPHNPLSAEPNP